MKKRSTKERLKELMTARRYRQVDIIELCKPYAKKYGVKINKSDISQYVSGKVSPGQDKLFVLGSALNVDEAWLMGYDVPMERKTRTTEPLQAKNIIPIQKKKIPLLGTIAAGQPIYAEEHIEEYLPIDDDLHADFALKVSGDSMINADINDGDIVFIKKQEIVENGQIAAVLIDDSATLKRFYKIGSIVQLQAENPKYSPIICDESNCDNCRIIGLAVAVLHRL
ncbi:repressor LexA [Dialister micraerophilus UPII 345-E]|uniref:Repressor LexA n=1 Tax=Dialister micraerophilus UPII 345-E TaxID=910314 RepID=E4L8D2_9FIRM|nr:transcriptional repressor LexA [Dialister micraerophilus]EFR42994.1 repressor LexA [Dialister micraerophilus UPII 345-E]